ncbi:hypothetical protein [Flavobacterium sandaracinum]|uniref:Uncharacterized protein n=1 Tax=Flavobacterium sandaracinum TaxID=2541733 RepID=A0A4R5D297_9FLAO|nr:hypothetical protein [Flavobacterium sandaracinum]TDE04323.1 hypothetical protein E0F91_08380 [Flavobacterium sandaracinum]
MKLTNQQIEYIKNYITRCDTMYYEVYLEILDHIILSVEAILEKEETISFENAVVMAKEEAFGKIGFKGMMTEKVKAINRKNRKSFNLQIKSYFDFPKSMIAITVFVIYFLLLSVLDKPRIFHTITLVAILVVGLLQLLPFRKLIKKEGLFILRTQSIFLYFNLLMIGMHINNAMAIIGKDVIDFHNVFIKIFMAIIFTSTLMTYFIFMKMRKTTLLELNQQIFA